MELNFEYDEYGGDYRLLRNLPKLKQEAKEGQMEALYNLGRFTFNGICLEDKNSQTGVNTKIQVEKNEQLGLSMLIDSASLNYIPAMKYLIFIYFYNKNYKDYAKCFELCCKAKQFNCAQAYEYEAMLYEYGYGVERDLDKAIVIYKELVDSGYKPALLKLAKALMKQTLNNNRYNEVFRSINNYYEQNEGEFIGLLHVIYTLDSIVCENKENVKDIKIESKKILEKLLDDLKCNYEDLSLKLPSNLNYLYYEINKVLGRIEFYSQGNIKDIYKAYNYFQLSHKYEKEHFSRGISDYYKDNDITKTEEEKFLEPIFNVGKDCPSVAVLDDVLGIVDGLPIEWPFAMKRIFIEEYAEKSVLDLISDSKDLLDDGTITNLIGALNGYLQEEIIEMEEKNALEKYPNLVAQKKAKVKQEKNYSQFSYQLLSGIERSLKNLFYDRYVDYLEQESVNDINMANFYRNLKMRLKIDQSINPKDSFNLGKFITLVGRNFNDQQQRIIEPNFLKWVKESSGIDDEEYLIEKLRSITKRVDFIRDVIRNPILHGVFAQKWTLVYSLNNILFGDEHNRPLLEDVVEVAGFSNQIQSINEV